VSSMAERTRRIESGDQIVVGVNRFTETEPSPLATDGAILRVNPAVEAEMVADVQAWRGSRDHSAVDTALDELCRAALEGENLMPPSIALAKAGGTTGEWGAAMRDVFGEFRAPTGVSGVVSPDLGARGVPGMSEAMAAVRETVRAITAQGGPPKILVGKPGLDGHSNGAEQIAVAARDAGMEVVYSGIRLTPAQIAQAAADEDVDVVGLSILSGSHLELVPETVRLLREAGVSVPVVVGGIIPPSDQVKLTEIGVARVYTPKDFRLTQVMAEIADLVLADRAEQGNHSKEAS
jgi:ethylmalonyl-CoA mutase